MTVKEKRRTYHQNWLSKPGNLEKQRANNRRYAAKPESRAKKRAYALRHKEKFQKYQKEYRRKHRDRARDYMLQWNYGVSLEWLQEQLRKFRGRCPICLRRFNSARGLKACVDHNHRLGKVRQVICQKCNSIIGLCDESRKILRRVIKYLTTHRNKNQKQKEQT